MGEQIWGELGGPGSLSLGDFHCSEGTFRGLNQLCRQLGSPHPNGHAEGWRKSLQNLLHGELLCELGGSELIWLKPLLGSPQQGVHLSAGVDVSPIRPAVVFCCGLPD